MRQRRAVARPRRDAPNVDTDRPATVLGGKRAGWAKPVWARLLKAAVITSGGWL